MNLKDFAERQKVLESELEEAKTQRIPEKDVEVAASKKRKLGKIGKEKEGFARPLPSELIPDEEDDEEETVRFEMFEVFETGNHM